MCVKCLLTFSFPTAARGYKRQTNEANKDSQRQRRDTGDILFCCSCVIVALKYLDTCRLIISLPNHRHPDFTYTAKFNGIKVNVCLKVL